MAVPSQSPLGKTKWLAKDGSGQWCAAGQDAARRQQYAADVYELYLKQLQKSRLLRLRRHDFARHKRAFRK